MAGGRRRDGQGAAGGDLIGRTPTDRGKRGVKRSLLVEADGGLLASVIAGANVHDTKLLAATLEAIVVERPAPTPQRPQHLCLDKAYDNPTGEEAVAAHGYVPHLRRIGEEKLDPATGEKRFPARRWVVERTLAWLSKCRALLIRYDKHSANYLGLLQFTWGCCSSPGAAAVHLGLLQFACALLWFRRLHRLSFVSEFARGIGRCGMAYLVREDVDEYGSVDAPEDPVPVRVVLDHDWLGVPFPALASIVSFEWEPGEASEKPDVFWYPHMRDWVCSQRAYDVLMGSAAADLHLIAEGRLDGDPVFLVQVVTVLDDVVDREHSIIERYPTYELLEFPAFFRSAAPTVAVSIFRARGSHVMIFMGETVKQALDTAGIKGFIYVPVDWSE